MIKVRRKHIGIAILILLGFFGDRALCQSSKATVSPKIKLMYGRDMIPSINNTKYFELIAKRRYLELGIQWEGSKYYGGIGFNISNNTKTYSYEYNSEVFDTKNEISSHISITKRSFDPFVQFGVFIVKNQSLNLSVGGRLLLLTADFGNGSVFIKGPNERDELKNIFEIQSESGSVGFVPGICFNGSYLLIKGLSVDLICSLYLVTETNHSESTRQTIEYRQLETMSYSLATTQFVPSLALGISYEL